MYDDSVVTEIEGYRDAATILAERANEFLQTLGNYHFYTEDEMFELLKEFVVPQELSTYISDDFSRGILVGKIMAFEQFTVMELGEDEDNGEVS